MSQSRQSRVVLVLGVIFALFSVLPSASAQGAQARGNDKVSGEVQEHLRSAAADDMIPVIVQTTGESSGDHFVRLRGRRGIVKARHTSIQGYSASLPASQVEAFADDPEVTHISFDSPVKAHLDMAYRAVKADQASKDFGLTGAGVGIAIVDTGVYNHPDLLRGLFSTPVFEVHIVGQGNGAADYYGHGTHVAGIINGNGSSSSGLLNYRTFKGIAPGARIISVRALYPDGTGYTSDIISGIDWAIKNKSTYNIRVLNLSLGHPVYESYTTDPLCKAVRAAYNAGIVVVAAAGNDGAVGTGFGAIDSPANEPSAITVGAMDDGRTVTTTDDVLSWYSSKGPSLIDFVVKPDIVAPGTTIVSLRDPGSYLDTTYHQFTLKMGDYTNSLLGLGASQDGAYYTLSGTSMAAPFVTGAAALMIQKYPSLNPATVKARLMASAVKDDRLIFETGAGELDIDAALKASGTATSAMSPPSTLGSDGNVYVQDPSVIWGSSWSLAAVWGGKKGAADGITLTDVSPAMLSALCAVWGGAGKAGVNSIVWNSSVTASGQIWTGDACSLQSTRGTVNNDAAVWGGGGRN